MDNNKMKKIEKSLKYIALFNIFLKAKKIKKLLIILNLKKYILIIIKNLKYKNKIFQIL